LQAAVESQEACSVDEERQHRRWNRPHREAKSVDVVASLGKEAFMSRIDPIATKMSSPKKSAMLSTAAA
jgi:hypothetical protein